MTELSPPLKELEHLIVAGYVPAAREAAEHLGPAAGPVLERLVKHEKREVRLLVLELAPLAVSVETSRSVIALLSDSDPTVHAVAIADLAVCSQKAVVPDLLKVLEQRPDVAVTTVLIRQIGIAGDRTNIASIRRYRSNSDPDVAHQASIAMARLGDETERNKILADLKSLNPWQRVQGLRDSQYIADQALAAYFGPALDDLSDFMVITAPHVEPVIVARVCDIAVQTMAYMGFQFSFSAQILARRSIEELAEARATAAAAAKLH
jgi:hypothetical protein